MLRKVGEATDKQEKLRTTQWAWDLWRNEQFQVFKTIVEKEIEKLGDLAWGVGEDTTVGERALSELGFRKVTVWDSEARRELFFAVRGVRNYFSARMGTIKREHDVHQRLMDAEGGPK